MAQFMPPKTSHSPLWDIDCVRPGEETGGNFLIGADFRSVIPFLTLEISPIFVFAADFIYVLARRFHNNQIWLYFRVHSYPSFRRTSHQAAESD